jgi:hypothetical protein
VTTSAAREPQLTASSDGTDFADKTSTASSSSSTVIPNVLTSRTAEWRAWSGAMPEADQFFETGFYGDDMEIVPRPGVHSRSAPSCQCFSSRRIARHPLSYRGLDGVDRFSERHGRSMRPTRFE